MNEWGERQRAITHSFAVLLFALAPLLTRLTFWMVYRQEADGSVAVFLQSFTPLSSSSTPPTEVNCRCCPSPATRRTNSHRLLRHGGFISSLCHTICALDPRIWGAQANKRRALIICERYPGPLLFCSLCSLWGQSLSVCLPCLSASLLACANSKK